jgi:hypothetical protein
VKQMGARSAGNPHAACDVEGTGNVVRSSDLPARQSSTLLIGGIEETSASFEARSAPRSYPTVSDVWAIAFLGADQLSSISPAKTRSRRSIRDSRSYSARSMSATTRCSHCRASRSVPVRRTS